MNRLSFVGQNDAIKMTKDDKILSMSKNSVIQEEN